MTTTRRHRLSIPNHRTANRFKARGQYTLVPLLAAVLLGLAACPVSGAGPSLEPGIPVTGALTPKDPTLSDGSYYDAYTFYGHTHELVRFYLSSSELDAYLLVVDGKGKVIAEDDDSGGGTNAMVELEIPAEGTYQVWASTFFPGNTGEYLLVWEDPRTPLLSQGRPVNGELSRSDEKMADDTYYDAYLLVGWEGETVRLRLSSSVIDTYLIVADLQGNWLAEDDDSGGRTNSYLEYTLPSSGAYLVLANTFAPEATGPYTLVWEETGLTEIPAGYVELAPGVSIQGELTEDDLMLADDTYYDVYFFEGRQGQVVRFRLTSPDVDAYLILYDAEGNWLAADDDSGGGTDALLEFRLPASGVYMIVANSVYEWETGRYTLTWEATESLVPGMVVESALSSDDPTLADGSYYHTYAIHVEAGEAVSLYLASDEMNPFLMLSDNAGVPWAYDDDSGTGFDALLNEVVPSEGTWQVVVTSLHPGETGAYLLAWAPPGAQFLTRGSRLTGELTPEDPVLPEAYRHEFIPQDGAYHDLYLLVGRQGEVVRLGLESPELDASLLLLDEAGNVLAKDDDSGGGGNALLEYTLPSAGVYRVVATSFLAGQTGRYELSWAASQGRPEPREATGWNFEEEAASQSESESSDTRLTPGVPAVGRLSRVDPTLDDGTYYDLWHLEGESGQTVGLHLLATDFEGALMLWDATGQLLAASRSEGGQDAYLDCTLPESGGYTVVVHSIFPGQTGHYVLFPEIYSDGEPAGTGGSTGEIGRIDGRLVPGVPVTGSTGAVPDHYRTYTLDVPQGVGSVVVTLQSKGDLDLFVKHGSQMLDWHEADFSSVTESSLETIVIDGASVRPGRYYIDVADLVRGSRGHTFALLATFRPAGDASEPTALRPPAEYVDGELVAGSRILGRLAPDFLARYWAIEVPPGAQTLHAGLFNASGPLELVAAPEGQVPITPDVFPYVARTVGNSAQLEIPVEPGETARWWIGVVSRESAPVNYSLEVRFDEPLGPQPTAGSL